MRPTSWLWRLLCAAGVLGGLCLAGPSPADEGKGKDKDDKKGKVVQIDLSKLPPDLAKRLLELSKDDGKGKGKSEEKGKYAKDTKKGGRTELPPGLASKDKNHPGRVAWLKAHGQGMKEGKKPAKKGDEKPGKKSKDKGKTEGKKKDEGKGKKPGKKDD